MSFRIFPVIGFTITYLAIAAGAAFFTNNLEFIFYIAVVVLLAILLCIVNSFIRIPTTLFWFLSIWGLLHMLGGLFPIPFRIPYSGTKAVLYSMWIIPNYLKYDHVVHAYGFGCATWVCFESLVRLHPDRHHRLSIAILAALAGMGLGAVNELIEFIAVLLIPNTNVGGYINTGWDLVANAIGSIGAAAILVRTKKVN